MKSFNWIEIVLLPLAAAMLESTWLALAGIWLVGVLRPDHPIRSLLPLGAMFLLVLAGAAVARLLLTSAWPIQRIRRVALAAGVVAILLTLWSGFGQGYAPWHWPWIAAFIRGLGFANWGAILPLQLFGMLIAVYLYWRGLLIGRSQQPYQHLRATFNTGLFALILIAVLATATTFIAPSDLIPPLVVYFTIALSALALASIEKARRHGHAATGVWLTLNRYWLGTVSAAIGLMIFTGLVLGWIVAPNTLAAVFTPIATLVLLFFIGIFYAIGLLAGYALIWFENNPQIQAGLAEWLDRVTGFDLPAVVDLQTPDNIGELFATSLAEFARQSDAVQWSTRLIAFGIVTVLVIFAVWLVLRRFRSQTNVPILEVRDSVATRSLITKQFRGMLASLLRRPARTTPYLALDGPTGDPRLAARRAYQRLLRWAADSGHPRPAHTTPHTFAADLTQHYPHGRELFDQLTRVYLIARYSSHPPTASEAAAAEQASQSLRKHLNGRSNGSARS